jgi:uncharacterized protein (TIGR02217 family)
MKYFSEMRFPPDIAYGATGGPEFFTDIVTSSSGFERRNLNWLQARCKYNLAQAIKTKKQLDDLIAFFRICQGRAIGFRFKDWSDYKIELQEISIADGVQTKFQLIKKYHYADFQAIRKITKPVDGTVKIYSNNKLAEVLIDYSSGEIKFAQAPVAGSLISAEAEFDVPVRFDIDQLITSIESYGIYSHYEIPLIEIKL